MVTGWDSHQSKAHPRFPNSTQYNVLLYLPPFGCNFAFKYPLFPIPQFDPRPFWAVENRINRHHGTSRIASHSTSFHSPTQVYLASFWHNTHLLQTGRQTDRQIPFFKQYGHQKWLRDKSYIHTESVNWELIGTNGRAIEWTYLRPTTSPLIPKSVEGRKVLLSNLSKTVR